MASLTNTKISDTYPLLLKIETNGVDGTLRSIEDGDGTASALKISSGAIQVDNIKVDGNAITSTDSNGNIDLTPDGSGEVNISKVDIDSGAIDGTAMGANSASTGAFTTISASGNVDFNGDLDVDGTTNLDAVDIDGAVDIAGQLTLSTPATPTGSIKFLDTGGTSQHASIDVESDSGGMVLALNANSYITTDFEPTRYVTNKGSASVMASGAGEIRMFTGGTGGDPSRAMTIDSSQRVGIGTTSPGYLTELRVNDTVTDTPRLVIRQLGAGDSSLAFQMPDSPYGFVMGVDNDDSDRFKISTGVGDVNSSPRFEIDPGGTTIHRYTGAENTVQIHSGTGSSTTGVSQIYFSSKDQHGGNTHQSYIKSTIDGSSSTPATKMSFHNRDSGGTVQEYLTIKADGDIGFNDTSPSTALTSFGSASRGLSIRNQQPTISFTDTDVALRAHIGFDGGNNNFIISSPDASGRITFQSAGFNNAMTLSSGGDLGIGTTSPVGRLDISQGGFTAGTQAIHFGADSGDNTSRSNNTTKYGVITGEHYSTSEEDIELITYYSNGSANSISIGGSGNSAYNAPTEIGFRIASGHTVTSNNANTILTINGSGATVKEGYPIIAGRGATSGGRILAGHYGQANNDFLAVLSTQYSSGGFILGYGVEGKENASGYVSTQDAFSVTRSAVQLDGGGVKFLATNSAVQTAPGSDVTMGTMASIVPDGDRNYMEIQGSSNATAITGSAGAKLTLYNYNTTTSAFSAIRFSSRANNGTRYPAGEIQFQKAGDHSGYVSGQFRIVVTDSGGNFQNRFQIANDGTLTASSSNDISDRELKENIETIDNGLSKIKSLKGRTFNWKEEASMSSGKKYGVIAQELEDAGLNDLVIDHVGIKEKEDGTFYKSVNMSGIIPILIEAVKELSAKVEALENA